MFSIQWFSVFVIKFVCVVLGRQSSPSELCRKLLRYTMGQFSLLLYLASARREREREREREIPTLSIRKQ